MLIPLAAPLLLYRDARRRFRQRNAGLHAAVEDAAERLDDQELSVLIKR
jgi:hypothetical protein